MTPRPQQEEMLLEVEKSWESTDVFIIRAPVGCHAEGTLLRTSSNDLIKIEDVEIGSTLLGPDGSSRIVSYLHRGCCDLYKIIPIRGESFVVTGNHILALKETTRTQYNSIRSPIHKNVEMTVSEYNNTARTRKRELRLYRAGPLHLPSNDLLIPPYILGIWIGDGTSAAPCITSMDEVISTAFTDYLCSLSPAISIKKQQQLGNKATKFHGTVSRSGGKPNPFIEQLRTLGIYNNKQIPKSYLNSSIADRCELLAGIMDTDGAYDKNKRSFEIASKWKHLAEQINYCFLSIGYASTVKPRVIKGKTYWRVCGSRPKGAPVLPCKLSRKIPQECNGDNNNRRFKVEYIGEGNYYGVTVDEDNLYLMDDYTVTHNCGKTQVAETISKWAYAERRTKSTIATPTNVLVQQYLSSTTGIQSPPMRKSYGETGMGWERSKWGFKFLPIKVANYYNYLALRAYSPLVIFDEAHKLLNMITELDCVKLWKNQYNYPDYMPTILHFIKWAKQADLNSHREKRLAKVLDKIIQYPTLYTMSHEWEEYRGKEQEVLKVLPLTPRNCKPVMYPQSVKKIVLMSATISEEDVYELGLEKRRVKMIDVGSPIPADRRPVIYDPIGNMSFRHQATNLPILEQYILDKMEQHKGTKGLIHLTYGLSAKLEATSLGAHPSIIWHNSQNKAKKLKEWLASPPSEGKILMACGLTEGLDLKGDLARWQILAKCNFPDMKDIAVAEKMRLQPGWYAWTTIREIEQSVGRVCRGEEDVGMSYVVDSSFARLYSENEHLFSKSFKEALR